MADSEPKPTRKRKRREAKEDTKVSETKATSNVNVDKAQTFARPSSPPSKSVTAATVVVFNDPSKNKTLEDDKGDYKAFMSSKVAKMIAPPRSVQEVKEDDESRQHDVNLQDLLKTTRLLEDYDAENLIGKERKRHMKKRVAEAGLGDMKEHRPRNIAMGMMAKQDSRDRQRLQEAKELGLYHSSTKHLYETTLQKAKNVQKEKYRRDRGIGPGVGRFKGGVLTLSEQDIQRVQNSGTKKSNGKGKGKKQKR